MPVYSGTTTSSEYCLFSLIFSAHHYSNRRLTYWTQPAKQACGQCNHLVLVDWFYIYLVCKVCFKPYTILDFFYIKSKSSLECRIGSVLLWRYGYFWRFGDLCKNNLVYSKT